MHRFVHAIRDAVRSENWFAALFLALSAPDVCGALENPAAGVGDRYKSWFNRYLKQKYDPSNLFELVLSTSPQSLENMPPEAIQRLKSLPSNAACAFTAEDCYRFRCKCLHQGLPEKIGGEKIHFTAPDKVGQLTIHMSSFDGLYQLQIDIFCLDICLAVERWIADVGANPDIKARMSQLIEVYDLTDSRMPIVKRGA